MSSRFLFSLLLLGGILLSCKKETTEATLQSYIDRNGTLIEHQLIACAASEANQVNIFFYPLPGASQYKYFECIGNDCSSFTAYTEKIYSQAPVFGGYLHKFIDPNISAQRWGIVTYEVAGSLYASDPILIKVPTKPTENNAVLASIDTTQHQIGFSWEDGIIKESVIYFQVISKEGNLVSGTYTIDQSFTYYDTSNVVLNINRSVPDTLVKHTDYRFTLMAVSEDNWVNLIAEKDFTF